MGKCLSGVCKPGLLPCAWGFAVTLQLGFEVHGEEEVEELMGVLQQLALL